MLSFWSWKSLLYFWLSPSSPFFFFSLWFPSLFFPYIFPPVLGNNRTLICRSCNLSLSFHGCLLDFGICITKPGQYCIKEAYSKGESWHLKKKKTYLKWAQEKSLCNSKHLLGIYYMPDSTLRALPESYYTNITK